MVFHSLCNRIFRKHFVNGKQPMSTKTCSHCAKEWHRNLSKKWWSWARYSFTPLQKSRRNHRSYRWTEALTGIVFVSAHELALKSRFLTLTRVVSYISSRYYHSNRTKYFWEERRSPIKIIYFWVKTEGSANTLLGSLYYRSRARVSTVVCHAYRDFRLLSRGEDRGLLRPPLISPPNL